MGADDDLKQRNEECLISVGKIGIAFSVGLPSERTHIANVVAQLYRLRDRLLAK